MIEKAMSDELTNKTDTESQIPEVPHKPSRAPITSDSTVADKADRGDRGPRGRGRPFSPEGGEIEETVVKVYRCATVVKGGRRFSFAALVVVGDRQGEVGIGYGKANEVPSAVEKAVKSARRNMIKIKLDGTTIPHQVMSKYRASKVLMIPASEGTGVIAGSSVRAVMEMAGVKDVLTKCYGSTKAKNLVKAAFQGLCSLRSKEDVSQLREVPIS
jgi:small subunit ribosomal protein S5